jgi:hypothetical protein
MLRLPQFLDDWLTVGGEVVSLVLQPPFTDRKIPGTHFCQRLSRPQGHSVAGRIRSIEKSNGFTGNRTHNLPACSIMPQPTMLLHALNHIYGILTMPQLRNKNRHLEESTVNVASLRPRFSDMEVLASLLND